MKKSSIKSFCKVNLFLKVIKKMANGYHSIESLITFCNLYDLIQGGAIGITALFFLFLQYTQRRKFNDLISNDFKETWMKFIISLTLYLSITSITRLFFDTEAIVLKNLTPMILKR